MSSYCSALSFKNVHFCVLPFLLVRYLFFVWCIVVPTLSLWGNLLYHGEWLPVVPRGPCGTRDQTQDSFIQSMHSVASQNLVSFITVYLAEDLFAFKYQVHLGRWINGAHILHAATLSSILCTIWLPKIHWEDPPSIELEVAWV